LTGKYRIAPVKAAEIVQDCRDAVPVFAANEACLTDAIDAHSWSFRDAMMWATAKHAECRLLISEDGQHGLTFDGVTIVDPFTAPQSPLPAEAFE